MRNESRIYSRYFTYIKPLGKLPIVRTYGTTIFTLFIMAIFIIFAIKPTIETILVLQKKLNDSSTTLEAINKKAGDLSLAQQNYNKLSTQIKSNIGSAVPGTPQFKSIIQTLEQLAISHDASISALQFQPLTLSATSKEAIGTLSEITFNLNTEGDYKNLILLLQDLKTSDRLI
ncbi:hypothetical protein HYW43_02225, partial [Candidatus Daviesbacteria bacterium]|nr:hypothetical protein [Candidatus Daviesbacteria bacterium]